jgi:hypothetical protein
MNDEIRQDRHDKEMSSEDEKEDGRGGKRDRVINIKGSSADECEMMEANGLNLSPIGPA